MPNPKNYIDKDKQYVQGYVRNKPGTTPLPQPKKLSWFWRIAWYWRLAIMVAGLAIIIVLITKASLWFFGAIIAAGFWWWYFHPSKSKSSNKRPERRTWRRIL